ncbi:hypothetical protein B0T24DRAFT_709144 [Lasiosphaeria ovina]|uniref:Pathogen-related protein n=1 Tax=Lasiosphaeria ovina TaxID=92902 RepID=A0AAE0JYM6_9PEZI|nr:hypothetical protein B0T24DRAFT_709144 [Lasiosphaeria ovina]
MASVDAQDVQAQSAPPGLPDYVLDADAAPDYCKTRKMWDETKKSNHTAGSLPDLVVKNWEVEASHKTDLADWRTIDKAKYVFSVNGGPDQTGEHMLKVGTYNALLEPSEFYCPRHSTFDDSHKTFKHMMPAFAWEVLEVYSGPPQVAFRWRHWEVMKEDYVGSNKKGDKVTIKAHGRPIDIEGVAVAVAVVNDKLQLQKVEVFYDPMAMFRQMVGADEDMD